MMILKAICIFVCGWAIFQSPIESAEAQSLSNGQALQLAQRYIGPWEDLLSDPDCPDIMVFLKENQNSQSKYPYSVQLYIPSLKRESTYAFSDQKVFKIVLDFWETQEGLRNIKLFSKNPPRYALQFHLDIEDCNDKDNFWHVEKIDRVNSHQTLEAAKTHAEEIYRCSFTPECQINWPGSVRSSCGRRNSNLPILGIEIVLINANDGRKISSVCLMGESPSSDVRLCN